MRRSPLGFHEAGLAGQFDFELAYLEPTKATGSDPRTLTDAAAEFWLFLPYVMLVVAPSSPIEPMAEAARFLRVPSALKFWELPEELVRLGNRGRQLGIRASNIFGIPKQEAPTVENFLRSVLVTDPGYNWTWALRLQEVSFVDPLQSASRPVDSISDVTVKAHAFALDMAIGADPAMAYLKPHATVDGVAKNFRVHLKVGAGDQRLLELQHALAADHDITSLGLQYYDKEDSDGDGNGSSSIIIP